MKKMNMKYMEQKTVVTWDKYSLIINGERRFLVGGEFHYWRAPDRSRWPKLLETYKTAGLNFIRIYFHWGYHNPQEDVFIFEDNRDVDYLLTLCEQYGFYVYIASGPYICAETTAGGYPNWFAWKRDIRVKHLKSSLRQKYDPKYTEYFKKWFEQFIPHVKHHQITEKSTGCVIGYQIENEYIEKIGIWKASTRYMKEIIQIVRDCGITVPTYHNDALEWNSWNGVVDLYTFDKYPIVMQNPSTKNPIPPWKPAHFVRGVDKLEEKVATFPKPGCDNPMIIPELQGGWFNQWGTWYGFDEIYDWYGPRYQKMVAESVAAQRVTLMNFYMFYGGTNWGSAFNPEVYTSYDYSACIREYGFQSEKLRYLRLFALFSASFEASLVQTEKIPEEPFSIEPKNVLNRFRKAADGTIFGFLRNLGSKPIEFTITSKDGTIIPHVGKQRLLEQDSFIVVANHRLNGFVIEICTLPIVLKGFYADGEILVVEHTNGELILSGADFKKEGNVVVNQEPKSTRYNFPKPGMAKIFSAQGKILYILCLTRSDLLTMNAELKGSDRSFIIDHFEISQLYAPRYVNSGIFRRNIWS
jgi:hypothetical protein